MMYKNENEKFHSSEMPKDTQEWNAVSDSHLTRAHVEAVFIHRKKMLSSIERDIRISLHEAISEKINYESTSLMKIVENDAKALNAKKRNNKILNTQYFIHKPLDTKNFLLP